MLFRKLINVVLLALATDVSGRFVSVKRASAPIGWRHMGQVRSYNLRT